MEEKFSSRWYLYSWPCVTPLALASGRSPSSPTMKKGGLKFLPSDAVDVTHSNGFYQHDEQQREGGCIVVKDVKPIISSLHGED